MAVTFDQNDSASWYYGGLSRAEATQMLMSENESGVFLVRDSNTIQGDFVLCVREDGRVSHYIINRVAQTDGTTKYRIGNHLFPDLPALLGFYKLHLLDSTPLVRPFAVTLQSRTLVLETVVAKHDFEGSDAEDLPFKKGEVLEIICKDEEQWWTARNAAGSTGLIPVPYVMRRAENDANSNAADSVDRGVPEVDPPREGRRPNDVQRSNMQRTLPALARVKQSRVPNAYDKTALRLDRGDIIKVTRMNINGQWEGELNGRTGHFPFTHVEFLDDQTNERTENVGS